MATNQMSLLEGDLLSQHRFVLGAILADALRVVQTAAVDGRPASQHDVDQALELVRKISDELRSLGREDEVPF